MELTSRILKDKLNKKFENKIEIDYFDYESVDIYSSYSCFHEVDIRILPYILKIPDNCLCKTLLYTTLKMTLCFCMIYNKLSDKDYYVDIIKFRKYFTALSQNIETLINNINKYRFYLISERKNRFDQKQLQLQTIQHQRRIKEYLLGELYKNENNPHYDTKITRELSCINKRVNNVRQKMYFIILCLKNDKELNYNVIKNIINFAFGDIIKSPNIHLCSYEKKGKSSAYHQRIRNLNVERILHEEYHNFKSQLKDYVSVLRNVKTHLRNKYLRYEIEYYSI